MSKIFQSEKQLKNIPLFDKIGYGSGSFSNGAALQIMGSYLIFFATAILGISGSLVGIAISISVIWDGFTDPIMGYISDITHSKYFGRRHIYLFIGSIGMAVFNYLLWNIDPNLSSSNKYLWIFINVIVIKTFMTIYGTPFTALGAELSNDYNERTSIQSVKTVFFLLGLSFSSVAGMFIFFRPTEEFPQGQLNPDAYSNMGLISSLMMVGFGLFCFFTTKKYVPLLPKAPRDSKIDGNSVIKLFKNFSQAISNKHYRYVALGYMFTNLSSAFLANLGLHVFTYTFNLDSKSIALIVGVQFLTSITSQPLWMHISKKIDKKPSVMAALVICAVSSLAFGIMVPLRSLLEGNFIFFLPFGILMGIGTGGLYALPPSMVADTIDVEELNFGIRTEGIFYGGLTLFYKFSQSIAIFLLGILLDVVGFDSALNYQPPKTVITLGFILSIGTLAGFLFSMLYYRKYDLNREKVAKIQQQIAIRSKQVLDQNI
jgi:glycoside/pentoside/hexuronide:cation symporter, GPH family